MGWHIVAAALALTSVVVVGCGAVPHKPPEVIVSAQWNEDQISRIEDGLHQWEGIAPFSVRVGDCTREDAGCVVPVAPDDAILIEAGPDAVCAYESDRIYISTRWGLLTAAAAHEMGHWLGLPHEETGVMFKRITGDLTITEHDREALAVLWGSAGPN